MDSPLLDGRASGSTRRAFLTRSAAGAAVGGLIWVAPSVLTVDAAAAQSCGTGVHTMSWATLQGTSPTSITSTGGTPIAVAITHTNTAATVANGGLGGNDCFQVTAATVGGQSLNSYLLQINPTNNGARFVTVTFTFPAGTSVNGLKFTLFDIDYSNAANYNFQDVVTITGKKADNVTAATFAATASDGVNGISFLAVPAVAAGPSLVLTGQNNSGATGQAPTSTGGNSTISSPDSVHSVTIRYEPGTLSPANPYQYVTIGNLTWTSCT